jgi:hypothetical protein
MNQQMKIIYESPYFSVCVTSFGIHKLNITNMLSYWKEQDFLNTVLVYAFTCVVGFIFLCSLTHLAVCTVHIETSLLEHILVIFGNLYNTY